MYLGGGKVDACDRRLPRNKAERFFKIYIESNGKVKVMEHETNDANFGEEPASSSCANLGKERISRIICVERSDSEASKPCYQVPGTCYSGIRWCLWYTWYTFIVFIKKYW